MQAIDRRTEAGRPPWAGGQAAAVDTCRAGRRCLPRGAPSPIRQGITDSSRSLRIFVDYLSETAQVKGTERLAWPSAARRVPAGSASPGVHWGSSNGRPSGILVSVQLAVLERDHLGVHRHRAGHPERRCVRILGQRMRPSGLLGRHLGRGPGGSPDAGVRSPGNRTAGRPTPIRRNLRRRAAAEPCRRSLRSRRSVADLADSDDS